MHWYTKSFKELTANELYAVLQLRNEVFVVEQNCLYQDADNYDQEAFHVMGWNDALLAAYCRLLPPGIKYKEWAIGRVIISPKVRKTGLGRELTKRAIDVVRERQGQNIRISAQAYLERFYKDYGFQLVHGPYDEVGIPHIEMLLDLTA